MTSYGMSQAQRDAHIICAFKTFHRKVPITEPITSAFPELLGHVIHFLTLVAGSSGIPHYKFGLKQQKGDPPNFQRSRDCF